MANQLGRYVWLVSLLRDHGRLTFEEIRRKWEASGLCSGEPLTLRTFHNHRKAIADIFQVDIECDIHGGYKYYIENQQQLEGDTLRSWLIGSYSVLNQIQADRRLEGRIIFEDVPSGSTWLTTITDAIRENKVLTITHQGYGRSEASTFDIEPYYLKVAKRRWYVVARSPYNSEKNQRKNKEDGLNRPENVYRVYGLDRIHSCEMTDRAFKMSDDFDIEEYFEGSCGIIPSDEEICRVVIRTHSIGADYLRSLPLHKSQKELTEMGDDNSAYFELHVKPTFDLYQTLLSQGDQIEVVGPEEIREQMKYFTKALTGYYLNDKE